MALCLDSLAQCRNRINFCSVLISIDITIFLRCLIFELFFFTNADVVTIKDETSK